MEPIQKERWGEWAANTLPITTGWRVRPLTQSDISDVSTSVDDHVRSGLGLDREYDTKDAARLALHTAPELAATGKGVIWGIAEEGDTSSSVVRGVVTLHAEEGNRAQVGFWLSGAARGRGIAAAAVRAVAEATIGHGGLAGLTWISAVGNVDSLRVARSAGFQATGSGYWPSGAHGSLLPSWFAHRTRDAPLADRLWADCLVEIAAGAWQLQPMDHVSALAAEELLPTSACIPTAVWAAKEITTARIDAVVALLTRGGRGWVVAVPALATADALAAADAASEVVRRYARHALGLITP